MKFSIYNSLLRSVNLYVQPKIIAFGFVAATIFAIFTDGRAASPGALDLTFGVRGTAAVRPPTNNFTEERAVAIQPDGKVVLAGYVVTCVGATCSSDIAVVRFNANGTPDTGFGTNGAVVTDYFGQDESAYAVAVQADGRIVVAAGLNDITGGTNILGFKVVRYNADGTLDTTFGTGGRAYESFDDAGGTPQSILIQPDGKIVVSGTDSNTMLFVARFNANGGLDTGFNGTGKIATATYNVFLTKLARQSNGKIIIAAAGSPGGALKLIRLNTDGTVDASFSGGAVTYAFADYFGPTVAVQPDDKILVSGFYADNDLRTPPLVRFNADGSIDTGFVPNHGAMTNGACTDCTQKVVKVLPLAGGKFYLAGYYSSSNGIPDFITVSRYLSGGAIDTTFGFRGTSRFRHTNSPSNENTILWRVNDAALQADGKIVIAATGDLPANGNHETNFLAIRINTTVTPPSVRGDFDGDRKTDFAVFRPSNRFWYALNSSDGSFFAQRYGADGDVLTPGDYNYDLKTDLSVFRPSAATWFLSTSQPTGGGNSGGVFGQSTDIAIPEDYDGDGVTDLAVFRPSNGTWNIRYSSLTYKFPPTDVSIPFGFGTDKPVPADYDGDGRADIAVFRPSTGIWYILRSSDGIVTATPFGSASDKTVQGDYDGDGKADIAVFRDGVWYILKSSDGGFVGVQWGFASDKPVPGDYDGDGKFDVAVFRPSEGVWYALKSSDSSLIARQWGISEDTPIPFTFVR